MNLTPYIEEKGQSFYDEYAPIEKAEHRMLLKPKPMAAAFGVKPLIASFNRVPLNWLKPR